ncbi:hypothetical protein [Salmonirosea aquatica]|uniref:Uncharacterized protein n=1 Tax=Salmonirosea aquatica TaxID=2654236 RepID=A0A7C9BKA4_9BACT|nr:hypothetical protein [Cytophagaceae bacterium SJW1-29]
MTTDNLIIIKGGAYNDIKKALRQWIDLYSKDLQDDLTFQIFKNGRGNHIIQADKKLDNDRFFYLVNYLNYPEDIKYKIEIEGYTTGKDNNQLKGKDLLVFISLTDKEYDNVLVTTSENENFKVDFGGKITETRDKRIFNYPTDLILKYPETININRKEIEHKEEKINEISIHKRFKILAIIAVSLTLIGIIINQIDPQIFRKFSFFLGMGIGVWFFLDYKMLQSDRHYLCSFGIAIGYFLFILTNNGEFNKSVLDYGALYPLTLLLVQKPARLIYKATLNREPVVDRPPPTFWDGVYMIILFFGFGVLPFLIIDSLTK